jgi:hypothetical protein
MGNESECDAVRRATCGCAECQAWCREEAAKEAGKGAYGYQLWPRENRVRSRVYAWYTKRIYAERI